MTPCWICSQRHSRANGGRIEWVDAKRNADGPCIHREPELMYLQFIQPQVFARTVRAPAVAERLELRKAVG